MHYNADFSIFSSIAFLKMLHTRCTIEDKTSSRTFCLRVKHVELKTTDILKCPDPNFQLVPDKTAKNKLYLNIMVFKHNYIYV